MIDPTALLAELAAIQRDVRTIHEAVDLHHVRVMPEATRHVVDRIASLMSSIAAQTPAEVDPDEAAERAKHWPACGRRKRTDARCVCDRDHDTYRASGHVEPIRPPAIPIASPGTYAAADNGMLAPIRARLDELERKVESLTKSADGYEWAVGMGHHIKALVGRHIFIDGGDPGDEQEAS